MGVLPCFFVLSFAHSRFTEKLDYRAHLSSREHLAVGFVSYGREGIPQAAREVHLFAEEAQGTALTSVGVVHLRQLTEAIAAQGERRPT